MSGEGEVAGVEIRYRDETDEFVVVTKESHIELTPEQARRLGMELADRAAAILRSRQLW